jgi:rhamnose transport system permease protein
MMALGQMPVILSRGIDLSVAANLAFSGMVVAMLSQLHPEMPVVLSIVIATGTGLLLGAVNATAVAVIGIPPIVVTLATLSIYRGLTYVISGGQWVSSHEMGEAFRAFPGDRLLGPSHLVWLAVAVALGTWAMLGHSGFGRKLYAFGGDPKAARYVGIAGPRLQFAVYCLSGAMAGLCGYLWVARYAIAFTEVAAGFELQAIAACVIGGISIAGGMGSVAGCILGALFLGLIGNALPVIDVSPFWQMLISGAVILTAVVLNTRGEARPGKIILRPQRVEPAE